MERGGRVIVHPPKHRVIAIFLTFIAKKLLFIVVFMIIRCLDSCLIVYLLLVTRGYSREIVGYYVVYRSLLQLIEVIWFTWNCCRIFALEFKTKVMKFYKVVNPEDHSIYADYDFQLVNNALFTEKELQKANKKLGFSYAVFNPRKGVHETNKLGKYLKEVEVSKFKTRWFFGYRFEFND